MEDTLKFEVPMRNAATIVQYYLGKRPSRRCRRWKGAAQIEGSWEHQYARAKGVRSERGDALLIETSPKFLFGHNVFGSSDLQGQVWATIQVVEDALGLGRKLSQRFEEIEVQRVDLVANLALEPDVTIKQAIRALYWYFHARGKSLATYERWGEYGTLIIHPKSKARHVFYDKDQQLKVSRVGLPDHLDECERICSWAREVVRYETRWGRSALRNHPKRLHRLTNWTVPVAHQLIDERLGSLQVEDDHAAPGESVYLGSLTPSQRALVRAHFARVDLQLIFDDRPALKRLREKVLRMTGVDIFQEPGGGKQVNVHRLINEPSARFYGRPAWGSAPYASVRRNFLRSRAPTRRSSR